MPVSIYLPIAELSANIFVLFGMGVTVGFLSGMFGVGGGFLMTPLLIFYNVPPAVAVATGTNQVVASSISGTLAHLKRGTIDVKLGLVLLLGGIAGSALGVFLFTLLRRIGQLDLMISLLYVVFLGAIGSLMVIESLHARRRVKAGGQSDVRKPGQHNWIHGLPFKMRFRKSMLYLSALPVIAIGFGIGMLVSVMGVGGGFIMVPALIYLLRVPTAVVIGTSLFQIIFVTAFTTVLQAYLNQTVDIVLALVLMVGGVIGAQFGAAAGLKLRGDQLRALLGLLVLAVCLRMAFELVITPASIYTLNPVLVGGE
jgi:uncharacterized membrane protein YfcA